MVKSLSDVKWKEFKIDNLFDVKSVKGRPIENYSEGTTPYISTSSTKNGLIGFINVSSNIISESKSISIDPIKGKAFFHRYSFVGRGYSGASINILYNQSLNIYNGLFICAAIEKTSNYKASYGYLFNGERLKKAKILLPANSKGEPDYEFMEEYIKEREVKLKEQYKNHVKARVAELTKEINPAQKWDDFFISDIFTSIQRGKRLTKVKQTIGKIPYVSSTSLNNGVDNFIGNDTGVRIFQDCLRLANSGSVGSCFYEPFKFVASDHVTHLKNNYSKYTYLFLACLLNRLSEKYNFNREIHDDRISREKILLPVTPKGEPDYTYMENYMKYLEQKKLLEYLDYVN